MKLHLPVRLFKSILSCLIPVACLTVGSGVVMAKEQASIILDEQETFTFDYADDDTLQDVGGNPQLMGGTQQELTNRGEREDWISSDFLDSDQQQQVGATSAVSTPQIAALSFLTPVYPAPLALSGAEISTAAYTPPTTISIPAGYTKVLVDEVSDITRYSSTDSDVAFRLTADVTVDSSTFLMLSSTGSWYFTSDSVDKLTSLTFSNATTRLFYMDDAEKLEFNCLKSVMFSGNRASYDGGAIYGGDGSSIGLSGNESVTFNENSVFPSSPLEACGGAIYGGYGSSIELSGNGSVTFSENTAFASSSYTPCDAYGGAIYGDAGSSIELCGNGRVTFSGNTASASFTYPYDAYDDYDDAYGGAIYGGAGSSIALSDNGSVTFSENTASAASSYSHPRDASGGAIYGSSITLSNNESVTFSRNTASSSAFAYGGAIYAYEEIGNSMISITNNQQVLFEKNVEKIGGVYRLRSIYTEGKVNLSAPQSGEIRFDDSIYVGSILSLNADYTDETDKVHSQIGDIIFSGVNTALHLKEVKGGVAGTTTEKTNSRTSYAQTAKLYAGRLRIEDGAVLSGDSFTALSGKGATVLLKDASLSYTTMNFQNGTTLKLLGENTAKGTIKVHTGASLKFQDNAGLNVSKNLELYGGGTLKISEGQLSAVKFSGSGGLSVSGASLVLQDDTDALAVSGAVTISSSTLKGTWTGVGLTIGDSCVASGSTITLKNLNISSSLVNEGTLRLGGNVTVRFEDSVNPSGYTYSAGDNGYRTKLGFSCPLVTGSGSTTALSGTVWNVIRNGVSLDLSNATVRFANGILSTESVQDTTTYWVNSEVIYDGRSEFDSANSLVLNGGRLTLSAQLGDNLAGGIRVDAAGTLQINDGVELSASLMSGVSANRQVKLLGAGLLNLGSNHTGAVGYDFAEGWTGTVKFSDITVDKTLNLSKYSNADSSVQLLDATFVSTLPSAIPLQLGGKVTVQSEGVESSNNGLVYSSGENGYLEEKMDYILVSGSGVTTALSGTEWDVVSNGKSLDLNKETLRFDNGVLTVNVVQDKTTYWVNSEVTYDSRSEFDTANTLLINGGELTLAAQLGDNLTGGIRVVSSGSLLFAGDLQNRFVGSIALEQGTLHMAEPLVISKGRELVVTKDSTLDTSLYLRDGRLGVDFAGNGAATSLNSTNLHLSGGTELQLLNVGNGDGRVYNLFADIYGLKDANGNALVLSADNNAAALYFDAERPGTGFWKNATLQLSADGTLQLVRYTDISVPTGYRAVTVDEAADFTRYVTLTSDVAFRLAEDVGFESSTAVMSNLAASRYFTSASVEALAAIAFRNSKDRMFYVKENETLIMKALRAVTFEDMAVSADEAISGGAIYVSDNSDITMEDNGAVIFSRTTLTANGDEARGGALYAGDASSVVLNGNGSVEFLENTAVGSSSSGGAIYGNANSTITLSDNGSVELIGNTASSGGAIYGSADSTIMLSDNGSVEFIGNTASDLGGAIDGFTNSTITLSGNGNVTFSGNTARHGAAIYGHVDSTIRLSRNGSVEFIGNTVSSSDSSAAYGGAIYSSGSVTIDGNDDVTFARNVEKSGSIYRLRSLYLAGDSSTDKLSLSAGKGQSISFYDSVYMGAKGSVALNADYTDAEGVMQKASGTILFSGATTEEDLKNAKAGVAGTDAEILNSRTSEINSAATLYGGTLQVQDKAVLKLNGGLTVAEGSTASLQVQDGATLNLSSMTIAKDAQASIELSGGSAMTASGQVSVAAGGSATLKVQESEVNLGRNALALTSGSLVELQNGASLSLSELTVAAGAELKAGGYIAPVAEAAKLVAFSLEGIESDTPIVNTGSVNHVEGNLRLSGGSTLNLQDSYLTVSGDLVLDVTAESEKVVVDLMPGIAKDEFSQVVLFEVAGTVSFGENGTASDSEVVYYQFAEDYFTGDWISQDTWLVYDRNTNLVYLEGVNIIAAVPEPTSSMLGLMGLVAFTLRRRRK